MQVGAAGLGIVVSDKYAGVDYLIEQSTNFSGASLELGFTYNEHKDIIGHFSVLAEGDIVGQEEKFNFGVGMKIGALYLKNYKKAPTFDQSWFAGIQLRFAYVATMDTPIQLYADVIASPNVFSFNTLERYSETAVGFKVQFLPSATFSFGYKNVTVLPVKSKSIRLYEGPFISFGATF